MPYVRHDNVFLPTPRTCIKFNARIHVPVVYVFAYMVYTCTCIKVFYMYDYRSVIVHTE